MKAVKSVSKHNKSFPLVKTTRTKMLKTLAESKGKFITTTHIGKDQKPHTINGIRYKNQDNSMGYIKLYSMSNKEVRLVNPQTLTDLSFQGVHYVAKK